MKRLPPYFIAPLLAVFSANVFAEDAVETQAVDQQSVLPEWAATALDETEFNTTLAYRNFTAEGYFEDSLFGLTEASYEGDDFVIDAGIAYQNIDNKGLYLNHLSYAQEHEYYDFKVGKFVSKVGVMDFLSFIDVFNNTRVEYYDDANVNIRYAPSWMAKIDTYPDENTTFGLYIKPYDQSSNLLFGESVQVGLNAVVPHLITHTGNADLDLIGEQVLLPVYENDAKPVVSDYLLDKIPNEDPSLNNTSIFLNFVVTEDDYTFGALHSSAYSSFPTINYDPDLVNAVEALVTDEDKEAYIQNYLADADNDPISNIDYFRYNQFSLYYESFVGQFGYRGEISYRDKFPLLNQTSGMFTVGLGLDHQSAFYNNFEVQYSKFDAVNADAYYLIWLARSEKVKLDEWDVGVQNILTYGAYDNNDLMANLTALQFSVDNLEVTLEYLTHSKQEYVSDTASIKFKVML